MATVLVVDDDMINRELLRALLSHHGHRALTANDGLDALEVARRERPDAVIADVLMPGLDGYELARRLRDEPATNLTPIAFYTAHYSEQEVRSLARACGVQQVIRKPSKPAVLLDALDRMLDRAPAPTPEVTDEEFAKEHVDALKAKLVEKAAALNRSEGRFRIIAESAPVGILLGDANGSAIYVNPRLGEIAGARREELLETGWLALVEPRQRTAVFDAVTRGPMDASHRHRARIDRTPEGPLWLDVHLRAITDDGQRAGFVGLFDDVTAAVEAEEREQAEREREAEMLRHTARLAHRLTEAQRVAHLGTWDLDLETDRVTFSDSLRDILGLSSPEQHRNQIYQLAHPDDRDRVRALVERAAHTGRPFTDELRISRPDGSLREMVIFGEPVRDHTGAPGRVRKLWGVLQDITEARVAQRTAEQARADWQAEHRVLELLQQAMLPAELPSVPRAHLAATYIAASDRLDIGGDWYDVFRLPDGRILLSVGDVTGHDQRAASIMGPIRTALRAYAVEDPDPASALTRLNRFIALGYPKGTLITALVGVYAPETGHFTWANAGHPAPLLATLAGMPGVAGPPSAVVRTLAEHGPVLGALAHADYPATSVAIPPGAALCCYTDGLVERRGSTGDRDHDRLLRTLTRTFARVAADRSDPVAPAARLVERLTAEMLEPHPPEDDVCLLVLWTIAAENPVRTVTNNASGKPLNQR